MGNISVARLSTDDPDQCASALDDAEKALAMAVRLTNQLLTFSRGGKPLKKRISLLPVIETTARFTLSGSRSDVRVSSDAGLWSVEADEGQISQVIQNLVLNGDQAMPDSGLVAITARNVRAPGSGVPQELREGRYVEIAVTDAGAGIREEHLPRIFDPYFTTKRKGSGLGLATSYSIVKTHDGAIAVQSEVGKGSTFRVYLPAASGIVPESSTVPPRAPSTRKGRILLMDDEELVLKVAERIVRKLGHDIETAAHGAEALGKYRDAMRQGRPFDVVVLDLTIRGGMGGLETVPQAPRVGSQGQGDRFERVFRRPGSRHVRAGGLPVCAEEAVRHRHSPTGAGQAAGRMRRSGPGKLLERLDAHGPAPPDLDAHTNQACPRVPPLARAPRGPLLLVAPATAAAKKQPGASWPGAGSTRPPDSARVTSPSAGRRSATSRSTRARSAARACAPAGG